MPYACEKNISVPSDEPSEKMTSILAETRQIALETLEMLATISTALTGDTMQRPDFPESKCMMMEAQSNKALVCTANDMTRMIMKVLGV